MSAIVQATCPGCKHILRIPAEWLGQAFKCKHCGMVIQARAKAPEPAPAATPPKPVAVPVAKPAARPAAKSVAAETKRPRPARSSSGNPFSFDDEDASAPRPRSRRRSSGGLLTGLVLAGAVLGVAVIATIFAWPYLSQMMARSGPALAWSGDSGKEEGGSTGRAAPEPHETGRKSDLPIKHDTSPRPEPSTRRETPTKPDLPTDAGQFPRRALAVSINNYLFANPINYGMPGPRTANLQTLMERFSQRDALRIPASQMAVLCDAADRGAQTPTDPVIRSTVVNFLNTSRAQDRIVLLIVGHVVEIGGELSLLPIDGEVAAKEGGIPLKWIYERLAACKARQKVLVLDTCRLDPAKGQERPGSGPMGEKLDAMLKEPPAGVQVWSACVAGQYSYEFESGMIPNGLFLDALYEEVTRASSGRIQSPADPFPLERLVQAVNARMKKELEPLGKVQTSRLTGSEPEEGAEPDPKEPAPPKPKVTPPSGRPGGVADLAQVRVILKDISFPPLKVAKDHKPLTAEALPPFPAETLKEYMKDGEATPLRAEVMKARDILNDMARYELVDHYSASTPEAALKKQVDKDQTKVAKVVIGELMEVSESLKTVADYRKDETKRWQATYDYVVARLEAQLAYLNEYQAVLGQVKKGMTPPGPAYNGWRLASQFDPQTGDRDAKKLAAESRKKLDRIVKDYPDTPWAIMAKRDRSSALGLEWQPAK
jgi:hypothetical protein